MRLFASALLVGAALAAPAQAATTFNGSLNGNGIADYRFSFTGGAFSVGVNSAGSSPIGDPYTFLFADNGSPLTAKTGTLIAANDDTFFSLNSFISLGNLAAGNYILSIQPCCVGTNFARSGGDANLSYLSGRTFQVVLGDGATLSAPSAVPEPATWAMMLIGFGAVGATMRRRKTTARIRFA